MKTLKGQKAIVTGGSRGLGLGIVEALVAQKAHVTVVARNAEDLANVRDRLGVDTIRGDIADERLARNVLRDVQPSILILNAGAVPLMNPFNKQSWETFNRVWDVDVKATFYWLQEALNLPLPLGSRVIIGSSGAAVTGSPLSGSYAGAKRMQWLLAGYANEIVRELGLDIRFQAILPLQIIGDTELGRRAGEAYAKRKGISPETYFANFGSPMPPYQVGLNVVSILTDPRYDKGVAFGMKGDLGIVSLDS